MGKLRQRDEGYCGIHYSALPDQKRQLVSELSRRRHSGICGSEIKSIAAKHKLSAKVVHSIATEQNVEILPDPENTTPPNMEFETAPIKPARKSKNPRSTPQPDDLDALAELERQLRDEYQGKLDELRDEQVAFQTEIRKQKSKIRRQQDEFREQTVKLIEEQKTAENARINAIELRQRTRSERKLIEDLRNDLSNVRRKYLKTEAARIALSDDNKQLRRICDTLLRSLTLSEEDNERMFMRLNQESIADALARLPKPQNDEDIAVAV